MSNRLLYMNQNPRVHSFIYGEGTAGAYTLRMVLPIGPEVQLFDQIESVIAT